MAGDKHLFPRRTNALRRGIKTEKADVVNIHHTHLPQPHMTLTDLLYAGKEERVGKWWLAQRAHGVYTFTVHTSRDAYNTTTYWSTTNPSTYTNKCPLISMTLEQLDGNMTSAQSNGIFGV